MVEDENWITFCFPKDHLVKDKMTNKTRRYQTSYARRVSGITFIR